MGHGLTPALGTSVGSAVANPFGSAATAAPFQSSCGNDVAESCQWAPKQAQSRRSKELTGEAGVATSPQETEGAASVSTASSDISHISEIFHYARKLMRGHQGFVLDEARFLADIDETPLFIREDGYLKRQA
jgi:hypothetical protein